METDLLWAHPPHNKGCAFCIAHLSPLGFTFRAHRGHHVERRIGEIPHLSRLVIQCNAGCKGEGMMEQAHSAFPKWVRLFLVPAIAKGHVIPAGMTLLDHAQRFSNCCAFWEHLVGNGRYIPVV